MLSVEWRSFLSQGLDLVLRLYRNHTQDIQIRRLSRAAVILAHDETAHAMNVNVFFQLRIQVRQKRKPRRRGTLIRHGPDPRRAVAPQHSSVTPPASGSGASTAGWPRAWSPSRRSPPPAGEPPPVRTSPAPSARSPFPPIPGGNQRDSESSRAHLAGAR